jgi:hypothetical protein
VAGDVTDGERSGALSTARGHALFGSPPRAFCRADRRVAPVSYGTVVVFEVVKSL